MKEFIHKRRVCQGLRLDTRYAVAISGFIISIVLHELFHVVMHWGRIVSVGFFSSPDTIVQIVSFAPQGYDVAAEEAAAYTITGIVILATIAVIWHMSDKKDTRTIGQILFPKGVGAQQSELLKFLHI